MSETVMAPALGPFMDAEYAASLQGAVVNKLLRDVEGAILSDPAAAAEFDLLPALQGLWELPAKRRERVLLHPTFRYWLQAVRRTKSIEDPGPRRGFLRRLPEFLWAEQFLRGQLGRAWRVQTDGQGGLRCPSLGRFVELGPSYMEQEVEIAPDGENVSIRCGDGLVVRIPPEDLEGQIQGPLPTIEEHGYNLTVSDTAAGGRVEVTTRDPWLRVILTGTNQRIDGTTFFGASDTMYPERPDIGEIHEALGLFERYWPEGYADFTEYSRVIVPIAANSTQEVVHRAFTVSSRQGAIYIGQAPVDTTIEMLIHENAHVKLRQIQALDPLLRDPLDESTRIPVPWRPDPRPIPGIFEGLFVFSHVAEFEWRRHCKEPDKVTREQMTTRMKGLRHALHCVEDHARLTEKGGHFLRAMKDWVSDLDARLDRE